MIFFQGIENRTPSWTCPQWTCITWEWTTTTRMWTACAHLVHPKEVSDKASCHRESWKPVRQLQKASEPHLLISKLKINGSAASTESHGLDFRMGLPAKRGTHNSNAMRVQLEGKRRAYKWMAPRCCSKILKVASGLKDYQCHLMPLKMATMAAYLVYIASTDAISIFVSRYCYAYATWPKRKPKQ